MIVVKRPGFFRLCCACGGAFWLSGTINPGFFWIAVSIVFLIVLFLIEDYVVYIAEHE